MRKVRLYFLRKKISKFILITSLLLLLSPLLSCYLYAFFGGETEWIIPVAGNNSGFSERTTRFLTPARSPEPVGFANLSHLAPTQVGIIDNISRAVINYFVNLRDSNSGLFLDSGEAKDATIDIGIAATGYGLTALALGAEYGYIDREWAIAQVRQTLQTLLNIQKKQKAYEKDLIAYLERRSPNELKGLSGWERFQKLEELRDKYECGFLLEKRGLGARYQGELKAYKREKGIRDLITPEQLNEFRQGFVSRHSDIYKYGRWGFFYRYSSRDKLPARPLRDALNDLSSVDTAIGIAGVLTAGYAFGDPCLKSLADQIYANVNWQMMLNNPDNRGRGAGDYPYLFSHGWVPEPVTGFVPRRGFLDGRWDVYTDEVLLLALMALGAPVPTDDALSSLYFGYTPSEVSGKVYDAFKRPRGTVGGMPELILSGEGGLWTYHMNIWLDTHNRIDLQGVNWYQNSLKATLANRNIVLHMPDSEGKTLDGRYKTFDAHSWPVTTMDTPLLRTGSRWAQRPGSIEGGYHMNIGVVHPRASAAWLLEKIPPLVAPNGYAGSIIHSLFAFLGLRNLLFTEEQSMNERGVVIESFSYDIDATERPGEWFASTQIGFSQGQFLQLFNLLGATFGKRTIWDITKNIGWMQNAFYKAGLTKISGSYFETTPEELWLVIPPEEVNAGIDILSGLVDAGKGGEALAYFAKMLGSGLFRREGEFKALANRLKEKIVEKPSDPFLNYMLAETRMAQIRNISLAATGERYIYEGDYYKTFEAIKYYFLHADSYYQEARDALEMARAGATFLAQGAVKSALELKIVALNFVITKNTYRDYDGQKYLFRELANLLRGFSPAKTADIAAMIYRYDWEAELSGALSLAQITQDLNYWEENYDFRKVRTPIYWRLER